MKKPKLWVAHGKVTHKLGAKCKFCEKVLKAYEKATAPPRSSHAEILLSTEAVA